MTDADDPQWWAALVGGADDPASRLTDAAWDGAVRDAVGPARAGLDALIPDDDAAWHPDERPWSDAPTTDWPDDELKSAAAHPDGDDEHELSFDDDERTRGNDRER